MFTIGNLKVGSIIKYNDAPYQVIRSEHSKQARSAAVLRTKLKHLVTGQVLEQTFQGNDVIPPADLVRKPANYQYSDGSELTFMDNDTFDQFGLAASAVGDAAHFMKEGDDVTIMYYEGKPVAVELPPKVVLEVVEAPPGIKGDTQGNASKKVTLETGYEISVPLFVNQGDKIRVNTELGSYVERA